MTQDIIATLIAFSAVGLLVYRSFRRKAKPEPGCSHCTVNKATPARTNAASTSEDAAKPIAFYGGSKKSI